MGPARAQEKIALTDFQERICASEQALVASNRRAASQN